MAYESLENNFKQQTPVIKNIWYNTEPWIVAWKWLEEVSELVQTKNAARVQPMTINWLRPPNRQRDKTQ